MNLTRGSLRRSIVDLRRSRALTGAPLRGRRSVDGAVDVLWWAAVGGASQPRVLRRSHGMAYVEGEGDGSVRGAAVYSGSDSGEGALVGRLAEERGV